MNNDNDIYGDGYFLAQHDLALDDFRASDKETKRKIIEKMLTLRHNMQYNKHLQSVYMKAKGLFDVMVEEHRNQLYYLDEIYRHINQLIRENLSSISKKTNGNRLMMTELVKDKKRIGILLKKMRNSYDKLMNIDTLIGVTIDNMNEIMFMDDIHGSANKNDDDDDNDEHVDVDVDAEQEDDYDTEDDDDIVKLEDDNDDEKLKEQIINIIKEDGCEMCVEEYNQGKKKCRYCEFNFELIDDDDNDNDNDDDNESESEDIDESDDEDDIVLKKEKEDEEEIDENETDTSKSVILVY